MEEKRDARMREKLYDPPLISDCVEFLGEIPTMKNLGMKSRRLTNYPVPGQNAAFKRLESFLNEEKLNNFNGRFQVQLLL